MTTSLPTGAFANAEAIYKGLLAMGLSPDAAAGVAGNIYQESHGNPGAGNPAGGGLFGETVSNGGSASGGSLSDQLSALAKYISVNGSVSDINAHASSPSEAATYFSDKYERPGTPNMAARTAAADWTAQAAQSGNWSSGVTVDSGSLGSSAASILGVPTQVTQFFGDASTFLTALGWLVRPSSWVRIGAFLVGVALLLFAIHALIAVGEGGSIIPSPPAIVPVPV